MRSRLAEELKLRQRERVAQMTPAERVAWCERLGVEGLAAFMSANGMNREDAMRAIKATRRLGRRPSRCLDERH